MKKSYKEFLISTVPFNPDLLSGLLWELNISGITEEDNFIKVFSDTDLNKNDVINSLNKLVETGVIESYSLEENEFETRNWNEEWEKNLNIIKVTDRIIIKPSSKEYTPAGNEIVITIDPKMSFGTGEHQTTKLVLMFLEKYIKKGIKVLDVGSGTAVLAIASVKLGAESATAIDNDELCFENGKENTSLNNVSDKVDVRTGEIKDFNEDNFDLILANIQKNIILSIADELRMKLKNNGVIILSGLLSEDEADVLNHYKKYNFSLADRNRMDEWIALVLKLQL
ncbi:MAG: 50S ribosomal protein L11 methyltransferase [Ignavibacteriales bacterium]|nr:MAG: 50S ribosomal protein L11 methyltransferase [Ignavibacteriales bacterium]